MTTAVKYFLLIINNKKARNTIIGIVIGVIAAVLFLLMHMNLHNKMQHQLQKKQKKSTAFGKLTLQAVKIYPVKVNAIAHILNLL